MPVRRRLRRETGKIFKNIGDKLGEYAGKIENSELLVPAAEAYSADPNWSKLANVLGQGSSQVLAMGTMAKFIGSGPTYGLFAGCLLYTSDAADE